jgi:hypothetical protein
MKAADAARIVTVSDFACHSKLTAHLAVSDEKYEMKLKNSSVVFSFQECNASCCNSVTCQLTAFAACATGLCCDIGNCQVWMSVSDLVISFAQIESLPSQLTHLER